MPKAAVGKKTKTKGKVAAGKQSTAVAPASVFVWAQCDNAGCQKWRKLPPASIVEDDVPWFCYMNPDPDKDRCSASEEGWNRETEEGHDNITGLTEASSPPPKASGSRGNATSSRGDNKRKAVGIKEEDPSYQPNHQALGHTPKRQRVGAVRDAAQALQAEQRAQDMPSPPTPVPPDPGRLGDPPATADGRGRPPPKHRRGMKAQKAQQGFDKLLAGGGEWEIVKGRGRAITPAPAYIWDALASHAPVAAELAACAANAASAAKYFEDPVDPHSDTHMQAAALTSRLAMVAAAALASEEASTTTAELSSMTAADGEGVVPLTLPLQQGPPGSLAAAVTHLVAASAASQQQQPSGSGQALAGLPSFLPPSLQAAMHAGAAALPQLPPEALGPAQGMVSHLLAQAALAGHRPQLPPAFTPALPQPSIPEPYAPPQSHAQPSLPPNFPQASSFPALSAASAQPLQQHGDPFLLQRVQPAADSATADDTPSVGPRAAADSAPQQLPPAPHYSMASAPEQIPSQAGRGEVVDADQHRPPDGDQAGKGAGSAIDSDSDSGVGGACLAAGSVLAAEHLQNRPWGRNGLTAVTRKTPAAAALQNGSSTVHRVQDQALA